jgi:hypothetical protein
MHPHDMQVPHISAPHRTPPPPSPPPAHFDPAVARAGSLARDVACISPDVTLCPPSAEDVEDGCDLTLMRCNAVGPAFRTHEQERECERGQGRGASGRAPAPHLDKEPRSATNAAAHMSPVSPVAPQPATVATAARSRGMWGVPGPARPPARTLGSSLDGPPGPSPGLGSCSQPLTLSPSPTRPQPTVTAALAPRCKGSAPLARPPLATPGLSLGSEDLAGGEDDDVVCLDDSSGEEGTGDLEVGASKVQEPCNPKRVPLWPLLQVAAPASPSPKASRQSTGGAGVGAPSATVASPVAAADAPRAAVGGFGGSGTCSPPSKRARATTHPLCDPFQDVDVVWCSPVPSGLAPSQPSNALGACSGSGPGRAGGGAGSAAGGGDSRCGGPVIGGGVIACADLDATPSKGLSRSRSQAAPHSQGQDSQAFYEYESDGDGEDAGGFLTDLLAEVDAETNEVWPPCVSRHSQLALHDLLVCSFPCCLVAVLTLGHAVLCFVQINRLCDGCRAGRFVDSAKNLLVVHVVSGWLTPPFPFFPTPPYPDPARHLPSLPVPIPHPCIQGVSLARLGIDQELALALGLLWDPESFVTLQLTLANIHLLSSFHGLRFVWLRVARALPHSLLSYSLFPPPLFPISRCQIIAHVSRFTCPLEECRQASADSDFSSPSLKEEPQLRMRWWLTRKVAHVPMVFATPSCMLCLGF